MRKIKNILLSIGLLMLLCGVNMSCSDDVYYVDGDYIGLESNKLELGRIAASIDIPIETNLNAMEVENHLGSDWCSAEFKDGVLKISVKHNPAMQARTGGLLLKGGKASQFITILQDGRSTGLSELKDDIKLEIVSGTASSFQNGEGIEKSFDGKMSTIYHTNWNSPNEFPVELIYTLKGEDNVDYIIYYPRSDGGVNGNFGKFELQAEQEGSFVKIGEYDFGQVGEPSKIKFEKAVTKPTAFKFIIESGRGGHASCAEMEFFKRNPDTFDPTTIFEDLACTKIKSGITEADLQALENVFYRDIALDIMRGNYDSEFRIQDYKLYEHPDVIAKKNKTSQYSLRDNPTGIYVNEGDHLVVFANESESPISIVVQDLSVGWGGSSFILEPGYNKFEMTKSGLVYVMNYASTAKNVSTKVHFATGEVNGYFDSQKHKAEDWTRILNKATYRDFDVLGKHSHITMPTTNFRKNTSDGLALINKYDEFVRLEQDFMGLVKYKREPENRVYFMADYTGDGNMWATSYRTGYVMYNMDLMTTLTDFTRDIWGPAHEVGHVHQTRPGFKWAGLTEVTNNIHSLVVQTSFGNESRLITDGVYPKAINDIVVGKNSFAEADIWYKLVSFWQLKLYLIDVLGKNDFYKDVYEYYRITPNLNTSATTEGVYQLLFTEVACDIAKLDLTQFFETWGYYKPVDFEFDDYGAQKFTITKAQVDATKARIAAKGYAKPKHNNIHEITDVNVASFK